MTSLYLEDHNVYSNYDALGSSPTTLAKHLHAQGFLTYAIVNMPHLNPDVVNLGHGFDTFVHSGNQRGAGASFDHFLSWLENVGEKPYFAWIHLADVHTPYKPPAPFDTMFYKGNARDPNVSSLARIWPLLPREMASHPLFESWLGGITDVAWVNAQYQGAASYVDHELGRLFDVLEQRHALDKTAIVFTSDHGESLGEHGMYFVHMGLYEPTVHIPLITYFPGSHRQGVVVEDVVQSVDIMPTLLEYLGQNFPENIRGKSLWPLIEGNAQPARTAFIEHAGRSQIALRSAQYKYIKHLRTHHIQPSYPFTAGREELYDLVLDPGELEDISKRKPAVLRAMRKQAQAHVNERQNLQKGEAHLDDSTLDSLRALGYVR
jgi:arylsulfatase A-like enzyme